MPVGGDDDTLASSQPSMTNAGLADAEVVAGRYRIVRWIGGGGMGRVYEALDTELDERVALKVLTAALSEQAIERFRREVKLTRRIQHRNVARMFDIGDFGKDKFLTMELVDGEPLTRLVGGEPLAWARLRSIGEQICAGLAAAHAAGVVHRDLKPDNVLLERGTGRVVITDFGIARTKDQERSVTEVGAMIGTPRYMSPEQLACRDVDGRSDLFSLGVMLFELATGTRPWSGDNAIAVAVAQATEAPRTIDTAAIGLPPAFAKIVAACLALDPDERPRTAELVGAALAAESAELIERAAEAPTRASRPSRPPSAAPAARQPPMPATPTAVEPTSLAVLPIACAPADEYLADGLLEDLTDALSTTPGLRVRPAGLVRTQAAADPREQGRKLHVDHVVAASLRRTPTGLRLNARLIGVAEGFQLWAHKLDFPESDILAIGEQLVQHIAAALSTRAATGGSRLTDPRAVELYLRARAEQRRFWAAHQQAAADLLEKAAEIAPTSAPILGALAHASVLAWVLKAQPELADRARTNLDRGLATGHGEAYLASAQYLFNQGEFTRGGHELGKALVRAPMSAPTHELAANVLVEVDGPLSARHHYETALGLDPGRGLVISSALARLDALEGNFASADQRVAELVANADPSVAQLGHIMQARLAGWRGNIEQVVATARHFSPGMGSGSQQLTDMVAAAIRTGELDPAAWAARWNTYESGVDRPVRQQLMGLQIVSEILLMLGRVEPALDTLEAAARVGLMDVVWLGACPLFQGLGSNARFHAVRDRVAARANAVLAAFRAATAQ